MINRLAQSLWRSRRVMSRSEWTARALHVSGSPKAAGDRGLVIVQIDGLARQGLTHAIEDGDMPVLERLINDEGYRLRSVYSGLPSSTPAAQAELFYGVPLAVPAYEFVDRRAGRPVRMSQQEVAADVERRLADHRSLLEGGGSYCNVYRGGALEARFCMSSLGWTDPFRTRHPLALPALAVLYGWDLLRAAAQVGREVLAAPAVLIDGVASGQHIASELNFMVSHVAVAVAMRELIAVSAVLDIARGLPVVYLNLIGYDECAHRRGPGSRLARRSLRDIDGVIGRMVAAAHRSGRRAYDVWVLSDHGQEHTLPYVERHGRPVGDAVVDVFEARGIGVDRSGPPSTRRRNPARALGRHLLGVLAPDLDYASERWEPGRVVVTAQGPLGHVYGPRPLEPDERDAVARGLVADASVPLVLAADGPRSARAWTADGTWALPDDAAWILGDDHPYLATVARELVELCHHPDAGDLVISGWHAGRAPVSFPHENGSHGGPGPAETEAFALVPSDTPLTAVGDAPLRPSDVRRTALAVLDGTPERARAVAAMPAVSRRLPNTVRVVTYNVHSCIGLDGDLSPERVARVIARHEPDVVALQELDVARPRTGGVDQAEMIAERLEMLLHFHPALSVGEERYGDAVLSRLPMRVVRAAALPGLGRVALEPRGALWVEVEADGSTIQVVNTHLSLHPSERGLQVDALLGPDWLGAVGPGQAVLCGDFNALSWFPVCRRITRRLRDVQARHPGHRPQTTWQGGAGLARIDHVFVDPAIEVANVRVADDPLARVASDHLPLVVDLRLPQAHSSKR